MHPEHTVAFFDILGFKARLERLGLGEMERRYRALIETVDRFNANSARLFGDEGFKESAYWTADGDVFILNRIEGAYASDSVVVWTPAYWPSARAMSHDARTSLARDPVHGWRYAPVPCDNLLTVCCELVCRSIEVGLPFRGALALGPAVLDVRRSLFLGPPLVEAATLERAQAMLGASFCTSFMEQTVPLRFLLPFRQHLKPGEFDDFSGWVLDWPRHWRQTRDGDVRLAIAELAHGAGTADTHFANTLDLVARSERRIEPDDARGFASVRRNYACYAQANLEAPFRVVRRTRQTA